ncbi:HET-domain-containing protein [Xylaria arbuscula]|nr:HET-domain-containing protein [Xylaria arbuscula]
MTSICATCQSITFSTLPEPPATDRFSRIGDHSDLPAVELEEPEDKSTYQRHQIGFPWHANLGALASSSHTCSLCNLVQAGVQQWCEKRETSLQTPFYITYSDNFQHTVPDDKQLFLTKRTGGSPGFLVYVASKVYQSVYLLTGVAFSVESTHEMAKGLTVRPPDLYSGSESSLDVVASFIKQCEDGHDGCSRGDSLLPSRILDVGEGGTSIKLIEPVQGHRGIYASLSYCWGDTVSFTSSRQTINARRQGIQLSEIPKTFSDAVKLCRHLDIRYLWIDSICICQDDADDWARESARMCDVYSNAYLVIAANHASNSSQGVFHNRPTRPSAAVDHPELGRGVHAHLIFNCDQHDWDSRGFPEEPLSKRGWALQERLLARHILHYNTQQIYFECDQGVFGEDGSFQDARHCSLGAILPTSSTGASRSREELNLWCRIVHLFGTRKLTKTSDKFPALSGLAALFGRRCQAEYIAGLWRTAMIAGLAWQGLGERKPQAATPDEYIGPSWSWASYGGVAAMHAEEWTDVAEVIEWHVELKNEANPFGELRNAWLRIRAPIVRLIPPEEVTTEDEEYEKKRRLAGQPPHPRLRTQYTDKSQRYYTTLDYNDFAWSEEWKDLGLEIMLLGSYEDSEESEGFEEDEEDGSYYGLIVTNAEFDHGKAMKRVGWMHISSKEAKDIKLDENNWRTVILV